MPERRRIAVITSTRADYGLLRWTMECLKEDPRAELQVIATGTHLSSAYGHTVDAIEQDGFGIAARITMPLDDRDGLANAEACGVLMSQLARSFRILAPDLVLVLGDRFEILAAAQTAFVGRIPIAHIHGGEITKGALDDGTRHAITKLSRLHLTSTEEHRRRVLQLGEDPRFVHNVGAPGLENLHRSSRDTLETFEHSVGLKLGSPSILLTYHPATASDEDPAASMTAILDAIAAFPDATILATGSNVDAGGQLAMAAMRAAAPKFGSRIAIKDSLGQRNYTNALFLHDVVVGNSSSGIIEAPSAGTPTVNVGSRQDGRPRAASVIDCNPQVDAVRMAIAKALTPDMREIAQKRQNPYTAAGTDIGRTISNVLLGYDLAALKSAKAFVDYDLPAQANGASV